MTFNQWCSGKSFAPASRMAIEAIWNALSGAGYQPAQISALLVDLFDNFKERRA